MKKIILLLLISTASLANKITIEENKSGWKYTYPDETIYIGKSCDVFSSKHGAGSWGSTASGLNIKYASGDEGAIAGMFNDGVDCALKSSAETETEKGTLTRNENGFVLEFIKDGATQKAFLGRSCDMAASYYGAVMPLGKWHNNHGLITAKFLDGDVKKFYIESLSNEFACSQK